MNSILSLEKIPNSKAPRPDGFPAKFFKYSWKTFPLLFFRKVLKHNPTEHNPNAAHISILLKPVKNPTLCSSYHPLTLMSTEQSFKLTVRTSVHCHCVWPGGWAGLEQLYLLYDVLNLHHKFKKIKLHSQEGGWWLTNKKLTFYML